MYLLKKSTTYLFLAGGTVAVCLWLRRKTDPRRRVSSSPTSSPHPRDDCLTQIYNDDETGTDIDIIAIHGLDTKSPNTWTWQNPKSSKEKVHWLKDANMLPSKVKGVRIFSYDWDADLLQPSSLVQDTEAQLALHLAKCVEGRPPAKNGRKDLPILFIASCFGGIILIKALVGEGKEHSALQKATRGVIFLATPFRGTSFRDVASWAEPGLAAWASIHGGEVSQLLDSVKGQTNNSGELVQKFTSRISKANPPYELATFYERGKTSLPSKIFPWLPAWLQQRKVLVDQFSASLDLITNHISLSRSHVLMNKFEGPECEDYNSVIREIQKTIQNIRQGSLIAQADAWIRGDYKKEDKLGIERLSGKFLPMDQCYINLAIVQTNHAVGGPNASDTTGAPALLSPFSLTSRLKVETADQSSQIELKSLFDERRGPGGGPVAPRRILIRGQAGVGKTTLCKKMVYEFLHGMWGGLFDRILWIPLRKLKTKPDDGYNLKALLLRDFFSNTPHRQDFAKELETMLHTTKFNKTLLVLDGLDEISEGLHTESEIYNFLNYLLGQPNIITTSRPSTSLPSYQRFDLELETIGFYPEQVDEYLEKTFNDDAKLHKVEEIKSFLQGHFLVQSLIRIPIQLDALCYIWEETSTPKHTLQTMTALYQEIEHSLLKKDIVRLNKADKSEINTSSVIKVKRHLLDEISFLESLAFNGLHHNIINFDLGYRNEVADKFATNISLDKTIQKLSFLRASESSLSEDTKTYHFLHLTYQEYFAAQYFVRKWISREQLEWLEPQSNQSGHIWHPKEEDCIVYLQKYKYSPRYDIFWRFVTGILQYKSNKGNKANQSQVHKFFQEVENEPRDLFGPAHQRLVMHCLSEVSRSQGPGDISEVRENLEKELKWWLLFEYQHNKTIQLGTDIDYPESLILSLLNSEEEREILIALQTLQKRLRVSVNLLRQVGALLEKSLSKDIKVAICSVIAHHHKSNLPESALTALVLLIEDSEPIVSSSATYALGNQSNLPESALTALVLLIEDSKWSVRSSAADALGEQSNLPESALTALISLIEDSEWGVRLSAADALGKQSNLPESALTALISLIEDSESSVRWRAANALGKQSNLSESSLTALISLIEDSEGSIAADALGEQSNLPESALTALVSLIEDSESSVKLSAADALGKQSNLPESALTALVSLIEDSEWSVRWRAAYALGKQSNLPESALTALVSLIEDSESSVRWRAADALRKQSNLPESALTALVSLIEDSESSVRLKAADALGKQSNLPESALTALVSLIEDSESSVRSKAADALGKQSNLPESALTALVSLIEDSEWGVRSRAADALGEQSNLPESALTALISLIKDSESSVRSSAADALGKQSNLPESALTALISLIEDSESSVRSSAADALGKQSTLPESVLIALGSLVAHSDAGVRSRAADAVYRRSTFYSILPDLNLTADYLKEYFQFCATNSFQDHLSWCLWENCLNVHIYEESIHIPLKEQMQDIIQEAKRGWDSNFDIIRKK